MGSHLSLVNDRRSWGTNDNIALPDFTERSLALPYVARCHDLKTQRTIIFWCYRSDTLGYELAGV